MNFTPCGAYRPSGLMCAACAHAHANCAPLPFASMPVMRKDKDGVLVVRCTRFTAAHRPL